MRLYSVYDVKGNEFFPPYSSKNDDTAMRTFYDSLAKNPHPEDYRLFFVTDMQDDGSVDASYPVLLCVGDTPPKS